VNKKELAELLGVVNEVQKKTGLRYNIYIRSKDNKPELIMDILTTL